MTLVKAQMSFYHDNVGTKAKDEMFDVQNEQLVSELEQAGYVQRVEGEALQAFEAAKSLEQQVGQRNALTNEAVSLAAHEQNMQSLQHQANFEGMRQTAAQAAVEAEISRLEQAGETKRAEQLRSGLESQRQAVQQQQQTQQQYNAANQERLHAEAEKAARVNAAMSQTQPTNTEQAEAEQAAANSATSAQANARAKKADK
jgi:hypothetical protein